MKESASTFDQIVNHRRSVRIYDPEAGFDTGAVQRSLERAVLAPNSSNMQLWEFYRVHSPEKLKELATYCLGQVAARTAREMVVVVVRKDLWNRRRVANLNWLKERMGPEPKNRREKQVLKYYGKLMPTIYGPDFLGIKGFVLRLVAFFVGLKRPMYREVTARHMRIVAHKSAALAAQTFMLGISAEGYDTCPMEGIDSKRIKKMLGLPWRADISMVIAVGPGKPEGIYAPRFRVDNSETLHEL